MKKTICCIMLLLLFLCVLCGCAEREPAVPIRVGFVAPSCDIYEKAVDLPDMIVYFNNNSSAQIDSDNFWFTPKDAASGELKSYIYVLEGKILLNEEDAPTKFEVDLIAVHKDNRNLQAVLRVNKIQTDLQSIVLKSEYNRTTCQMGKSLQFSVTLVPEGGLAARPEGTSFRDYLFKVEWDKDAYPGRCASVTIHGGLLTVHSAAGIGMQLTVTVSVVAQNDTVFSAATVITVVPAPY